ncbi:erythromycin esterase family protein [Nonomuraea gerenzanensis]|uniref:Erythromycin esterase type I n=1 Tax=Nonomuraea gerenzanensis TaxID=93944 RepID=A0A1M4EAG8_9ACTN|nr:erythromycin esterase family protein [Nonomuraea gerenzanensis]UBU18103.1 erythromycin esterase family protein [Nonomuraea gerenzanensis]SBO95911.1 Erythromycin esterase type I [Nonomuraea gerenzanensis]
MPDEVTGWLAARAVPLTGLAPLRAAFQGVRVVGLGEATHGSAEFFLARWRLTEFLIEELGFTILAIEASAAAAHAVDDYTAGGPGDPRRALAGLGFWTLRTAEMLTVLERLRAHNRTAARPVRFVGIDPQNPATALRALRDSLGQDAAPLLDPLAGLDLSGFLHRLDPRAGEHARRLEEYVAAHGPAEAREHALILRQYTEVAARPRVHTDPERTLSALRDRYMAENAGRLLADPEAKVVLWAHNGHVKKSATHSGFVPMGAHLADEFGDAYYALGVLFGHGGFRAIRRLPFGRMTREPARFRVPPADTPRHVAARLAAARPGDYVVDLRGGDRPEPVAAWLSATGRMRSFGGLAGRRSARSAFSDTVPADEFDGLAFLPQVSPSTPL